MNLSGSGNEVSRLKEENQRLRRAVNSSLSLDLILDWVSQICTEHLLVTKRIKNT